MRKSTRGCPALPSAGLWDARHWTAPHAEVQPGCASTDGGDGISAGRHPSPGVLVPSLPSVLAGLTRTEPPARSRLRPGGAPVASDSRDGSSGACLGESWRRREKAARTAAQRARGSLGKSRPQPGAPDEFAGLMPGLGRHTGWGVGREAGEEQPGKSADS